MDINIKRFVDIDIKYHVASSTGSIRDTAALLTSEGTAKDDKVFSSYEEMASNSTYKQLTSTMTYAKLFFMNGGLKLHVYCGIVDKEGLVSKIKALPNEEIVVASTLEYSIMRSAASDLTNQMGEAGDISKIYGINQKILLARLPSERLNAFEDASLIENFAVKVSDITGAEMTIAAYLTKIQIYGNNTVLDYAFTAEKFNAEDESKIKNDDAILGTVLADNLNIDMKLAGSYRNLGGNLTNGHDLTNHYTLIVLHQTVTDRLVSLLVQKPKGNVGVSAIYTTIAGELGKYVTNGYLSTDKTWTDEDKTVVYNNKNYTLIKKGTALTLGYHIVVLPLSSLSEQDKANRKCPPIYIFLADSYGIRNITISGEVI